MSIKELQMTGNKAIVDNYFPSWDNEFTETYNQIRLLEPLITADMRRLSTILGTDFVGTEYSVKTASSIEDKLQRAEKHAVSKNRIFNAMDEMLELKDVIRYTEICEHDDMIAVAHSTIENLQNEGYILSGISNYYAQPFPDTGYKGLHLNFITPYGQEIELQVHSQQSFEAKQKGHCLYEQIRSVSSLGKDKEQMKEEINKVHSSIPNPNGYMDLPVKFKLQDKDKIIKERRFNTDVFVEQSSPNELPYAMVYSICVNDEPLFFGFENVYTDGSIRSYQNNIKDGIAKYCSLDKNGVEIATHKVTAFEPTIQRAMEIEIGAEKAHAQWMEQNFSEKMLEDIDMTHGINSDKELENNMPSVSEFEYDTQELF